MRQIFIISVGSFLFVGCLLKKDGSKSKESDNSNPEQIVSECQNDEITSSASNFDCVAPVEFLLESQNFSKFSDSKNSSNDYKTTLSGSFSFLIGIGNPFGSDYSSKSIEKDVLDCECQAKRSDNQFIYIISSSVIGDKITSKDFLVERYRIDKFIEGPKYAASCFNEAFPRLKTFVEKGTSKWLGTRTQISKDPEPEKAMKSAFCRTGNQECFDVKGDGSWLCRDKDQTGEFKDNIGSYFPIRVLK